jgi:large subunit ribosomal protein L29
MAQLKELSDLDLVRATSEAERELLVARFKRHQGQLENTATLKVIRRRIARLKTEQRAREVAGSMPKGALERAHIVEARASRPASAPESAGSGAGGGFLKGIVDKLTGPA